MEERKLCPHLLSPRPIGSEGAGHPMKDAQRAPVPPGWGDQLGSGVGFSHSKSH